MVIPVMSGASLTSSVVAKPSADAVSLPEVLLSAVASEVLSLLAVLSETDVLSVWLSETSAADAVDVLLSETAEVPDADDVLLPVDAVLPQAVSPAQSRPSSSASIRFFMCVTSFAYIIQESKGVVKHKVNVVILQGRSLKAGGCVRAESVSLVNYLHMCNRGGEQCSPTKRKSLILSFVLHKKGCSL